jgi:hypothetical protein
MQAQWHAAYMSTQNGVAGTAWYFEQCSSMLHGTALQAQCELCSSRALLGGHAQHVITQLAQSVNSYTSPCCFGSSTAETPSMGPASSPAEEFASAAGMHRRRPLCTYIQPMNATPTLTWCCCCKAQATKEWQSMAYA